MTVHKREGGRGWWVHFVFTYPDGSKERVRKPSPVQTRRGAEEYERQLRAEMSKPDRKELKRIRLKDFAKEFLEIHVAAKKKYSTQVTYESTIRVHLVPNLGDLWVHEIDAKTIEKLQAKVGVDRSAKTVRNTIGVLSKMLHVAQAWGHVRELPAVEFGKVVETGFRFLDDRERLAVLDAAGKYWYGPIFVALRAMEREQLFLDKAKIRIDRAVWRGVVGLPKHDKIRTVDIPPSLVAFLRTHLKVVPMSSRLVFPKVGGGMIQERKADTGLRRACVRAEVEPFGWHVLRHTYASRLMMSGMPIPALRELLGHSDIRTTMRYAHLAPGFNGEAVKALDVEATEVPSNDTSMTPGSGPGSYLLDLKGK